MYVNLVPFLVRRHFSRVLSAFKLPKKSVPMNIDREGETKVKENGLLAFWEQQLE